MAQVGDYASVEDSADEKGFCVKHGEFAVQIVRLGKMVRALKTCPTCVEEARKAEEDARRQEQRRQFLAAQLSGLMKQAAIPPRFVDRRFSNYSADAVEQKRALESVKDYASEFDEACKSGRSLILCGLPGTGKTHLAIAVAHELISMGKTALFTSAMNAVRRVRETYRKDSAETEREVVAAFTKPDLLIIDEVGQQFGTDAEKVTLFDIINARYESLRPMIVISNLDLAGISEYLGERAFDRLREGGGKAVQFTWKSYRRSA